uniref:AB hydrolase-1 domain-containing protein n=1 Tax=Strigamia maritima TaxID=126957 RepID=T1IHM4_STRMM
MVCFNFNPILSKNAEIIKEATTDIVRFILADQLFDVWLGNVRGNEGSSHRSHRRSEAKFWDFSWEEMADEDLPAIIDYIRNLTEYKKILYIGHS